SRFRSDHSGCRVDSIHRDDSGFAPRPEHKCHDTRTCSRDLTFPGLVRPSYSATIRKPAQPRRVKRKTNSEEFENIWLPPRDSNPDMLIKRLAAYHSSEFPRVTDVQEISGYWLPIAGYPQQSGRHNRCC